MLTAIKRRKVVVLFIAFAPTIGLLAFNVYDVASHPKPVAEQQCR